MKYLLASFLIIVFSIVGVISPLKNIVVKVISPVQFGLSKTAFNLKSYLNFFEGFNSVRNQNLRLLEENQNLIDQVVSLKIISRENDLLKEQLKLQQNNKNIAGDSMLLAQVMSNYNEVDDGTLIANVGSSSGVRSGDMVVIGENLVGTIKSVEFSKSIIELITSPNISFTVYDIDSKDSTQGLAKGKHGSFLSLQRVSVNDSVNINDVLVTSGKDGIFKPNFTVGKITHIYEDPSQPLKSADVQTMLDLSKLTKVFIILQSGQMEK